MSTFTVIVLLCIAAIASAQVVNPSANDLFQNDNNVLKLALTVENFDTNYYARYLEGANAFTLQNFTDAGYNADVYNLFLILLANERAHVTALQATLFERNGTTVPLCTYNYPATNTVNDFVFWSKMFENVGTAAYDGGINAIYNKTLQTSSATIATVEARHAAFLNTLPVTFPAGVTSMFGVNVTFPFPYDVDLAFNGTTVYQLISPYLTCPYTLPINPKIALVVPVPAPGTNPANPSQYQVTANDVNALNFALTLELLEATFYNRYLGDAAYDTNAFIAAGYTASQRAYLEVVRAHENFHVTILSQTIRQLGFTPVPNCTYNFPVSNVSTFIATAIQLENAGVSAYDGSVNTINDPMLRQSAAQIATVEARHAAYINQLVNYTNPYSAAFDTPLSAQAVYNAITAPQPANGLPLLSGCPAPTLPAVVVITPYNNGTTGATTGSTTGSRTTGATTTTGTGGSGSGSGTSSTSSASSLSVFLLFNVVFTLVAFLL